MNQNIYRLIFNKALGMLIPVAETTRRSGKAKSGTVLLMTGMLATTVQAELPEADVVLMNAAHPDAAHVPPLVTRPFSFAECLHTPPMLDRFSVPSWLTVAEAPSAD